VEWILFFPLRNKNFTLRRDSLTNPAVAPLAALQEGLKTETVAHRGKCTRLFAQPVAQKPLCRSNLPAISLFTAVIVTNRVVAKWHTKIKIVN